MTGAAQPAGTRLSAAEAQALASAALITAGAADDVAEAVAAHLVEAELAGHPSHGLRQIPVYCANAGRPGCDLRARPRVTARRPALTTIDAGGGLGYLALTLAVDCAATATRKHGVAASAVLRCGHAGRAGAWAERGTRAGCVTIITLGGADPPFVVSAAPGARPALHTNPVAIGVPCDGAPLLLDMATSAIAEGKVHVALAAGRSLPPGCILGPDGLPSADPADFVHGGSLLPAAGHKGFGLSAMIEALAVSLTGADGADQQPREGALVLCIDAAAFRPARRVADSVARLRARIRSSGSKGQILAPGDPEELSRAAAAGSIAVDPALLAQLRQLAQFSHRS
jgi:LDH2 family malate/lactate/ureidoglycolate dehydrogenase